MVNKTKQKTIFIIVKLKKEKNKRYKTNASTSFNISRVELVCLGLLSHPSLLEEVGQLLMQHISLLSLLYIHLLLGRQNHLLLKPLLTLPIILIILSYHQIIKCIQLLIQLIQNIHAPNLFQRLAEIIKSGARMSPLPLLQTMK